MHLKPGYSVFFRLLGQRFLVEVLEVTHDTITVSFPGESYPVEGMGVDIEVHERTSVLTYHTQVLEPPTTGRPQMLLQRAASLTRRKHRGAWRIPFKADAVLRHSGDPQTQVCIYHDLSSQGALVHTNAGASVGDIVEITLPIPSGPGPWVRAKVLRVEPGTAPLRRKQRLGLVFLEMPAETKRTLTRFLWVRLLELYPREMSSLYPGSGRG